MRPVWSGSIGFGLVSIPVQLYNATEDSSVNLDLLHKPDMGKIGYQKICKAEGKPVANDEIMKGYEISKDEYVLLDEKDLAQVEAEKSKSIDIIRFIDVSEVDSIYFEKPYYLVPAKGGNKPYALLRKALEQSNRAALAQFVMRNKSHLTLVKVHDDILILNMMRFPEEIRSVQDLELPTDTKLDPKELDLAMALIDQLTGTFNPSEFKDTYKDSLMQIIDEKAEGRQHVAQQEGSSQPSNVKDIMSLLKASLEKNQSVSDKPEKTPSRRSRKKASA